MIGLTAVLLMVAIDLVILEWVDDEIRAVQRKFFAGNVQVSDPNSKPNLKPTYLVCRCDNSLGLHSFLIKPNTVALCANFVPHLNNRK
jgi:hypothetical protein